MLKFYLCLNERFSECFIHHRNYFLNFSNFKYIVENIFLVKYNIPDILDNDVDAIISRLFFIQNREPTSWFLGL